LEFPTCPNQKVFPKGELQPTKGFLWDFCRDAMGILWYFHDVAINNFWRISMGFLKGCYGNSMVFLWDFHWIPMVFP